MNPEKESGAVRRVAEKVGTFLSETYTKKGALKKEMKQYAQVFNKFTGSQREEMQAYYEKRANKSATFKVIRNWVATGAGITLGYVALARPELIVGAVKGVADWTVGTLIPGIKALGAGAAKGMGDIGTAIGAGWDQFGGWAGRTIDGIKSWMFDVNNPMVLFDSKDVIDPTAEALRSVKSGIGETLSQLGTSFVDSFSPLADALKRGPQIPLPVIK